MTDHEVKVGKPFHFSVEDCEKEDFLVYIDLHIEGEQKKRLGEFHTAVAEAFYDQLTRLKGKADGVIIAALVGSAKKANQALMQLHFFHDMLTKATPEDLQSARDLFTKATEYGFIS